jgi:hypothetical protein
MHTPHRYDKADFHIESIEKAGLSFEHACNHTIVFLRWLIEHQMLAPFDDQNKWILREFTEGRMSIYQVYSYYDCCLISDMLTKEGDAFAMHYFDFQRGRYLQDYMKALQDSLPTEFHIDYNEKNYQIMKNIIDNRYARWKRFKHWWWPF